MLVDNEVMPVAVGDIDSIINELNALSDKNDEDLTKQVDALIECKNTIQKLADKMKGNGDKLVNNEIMLAKAIEILYNMQPVFEYHNVRVKYFNELKNNLNTAIGSINAACGCEKCGKCGSVRIKLALRAVLPPECTCENCGHQWTMGEDHDTHGLCQDCCNKEMARLHGDLAARKGTLNAGD